MVEKNNAEIKKEEFKNLILRRLNGIILHWDNAIKNYNDIDCFLIYLNSLIQDLRNITFILQKHKKLYELFDEWYGFKQEEMKNDFKLKWIVNSRNKVVKEEDLKLNSIAKITLSNWLDNKLPDLELDPFLSNNEILSLFISISKFNGLISFSNKLEAPLLQINRIWIDKENIEVLENIYYGYKYFSNLIYEFIEKLKILNYKKSEINLNELYESKEILIDIKTGGILEKKIIKFDIQKVSKKVLKKAEQLSGELKMGNTGCIIKDKMLWHLDIAKKIILEGEEHLPTCFLYDKSFDIIEYIPGFISGRTEKYAWMRELSNKLKNNSIHNIILVSEFWNVSLQEYENHISSSNPSLKTADGEGLQILFLNKELNIKSLIATFIRKKKNVNFDISEFEENIKIENSLLLKPLYDVWFNKLVGKSNF